MANPADVAPVKLLVAVLWSDHLALQQSLALLRQQWGDLDWQSIDRHFDATDYYEREMGPGLQRRLVTFQRLASPAILSTAKLFCQDVEQRFASSRRRLVNLDVGYLDHNKLVLASLKAAGQKIYLGGGVYADLIARYRRGRYQPFEWTFPDFSDGRYDDDLVEVRQLYLAQLRSRGAMVSQ